jgi:hypothetical protein
LLPVNASVAPPDTLIDEKLYTTPKVRVVVPEDTTRGPSEPSPPNVPPAGANAAIASATLRGVMYLVFSVPVSASACEA